MSSYHTINLIVYYRILNPIIRHHIIFWYVIYHVTRSISKGQGAKTPGVHLGGQVGLLLVQLRRPEGLPYPTSKTTNVKQTIYIEDIIYLMLYIIYAVYIYIVLCTIHTYIYIYTCINYRIEAKIKGPAYEAMKLHGHLLTPGVGLKVHRLSRVADLHLPIPIASDGLSNYQS